MLLKQLLLRNPLRVGGYATGRAVHSVFVVGHLAYLANDSDGLLILDVTDPAQPDRLGICDTSGMAYGVEVGGDYAYVADWSGLQVIDVSDPMHPAGVGRCAVGGSFGVRVVYPYAYLGAAWNGLRNH